MAELPLNSVLCGHILDILAPFPDESIDFVMTSPPYWGLRDYGEGTDAVWGGDKECEHTWSDNPEVVRFNKKKWKEGGEVVSEKDLHDYRKRGDSTCRKCGAWRGQLGLEPHPRLYLDHMTTVCRELKRVLKKSGSMYVNMGDTYYSAPAHKQKSNPKDLFRHGRAKFRESQDDMKVAPKGKLLSNWLQPKQKLLMPHRLAIELQDQGWILRNDIVWHKPNAMPSSVKDRLNCCHEYVFHFVKARRYFYDLDAIREPHKASSVSRVSQDLSKQHGGPKEKAYQQDNIIPAGGSRKEISQILKNLKPNILTGKGKNPSDVFLKQDNVPGPNKPTYEGFNARYVPREDGKNPGDVYAVDYEQLGPRSRERMKGNSLRTGWTPSSKSGKRMLRVDGKNPGDFWSLSAQPFPEAHFAVYPVDLCLKPIKSSCPDSGIVLDPFCGAGSTLVAAQKLGRRWIGIDISPEYCEMAKRRIESECAMKLLEWM